MVEKLGQSRFTSIVDFLVQGTGGQAREGGSGFSNQFIMSSHHLALILCVSFRTDSKKVSIIILGFLSLYIGCCWWANSVTGVWSTLRLTKALFGAAAS